MMRLPSARAVTAALAALSILQLLAFDTRGAAAASPATSAWRLTWHDEFDAGNGAPPDPSKWVFDLGGSGWGNHELEYYTSRPENVRQENGHLVIQVRKEAYAPPGGGAWNYTSARIKTAHKFTQAYGRFEARIRIPAGQGLWPAFWMLGENFDSIGWPRCGEIDIMENRGREPATVHGTIHGPGYAGASGLTAAYVLPGSPRLADDFHLYAAEWEPGIIRFYVDGVRYATRRRADLGPGQPWVFDHPFYLILNVAVGGYWPGNPDGSTEFPQSMLVDYVRVLQRSDR